MPPLHIEVTGAEFRSNGQEVFLSFTTRKGRSKVAKKSLKGLDYDKLGVAGVSVDGKRIHGPQAMSLVSGGIEHQVSSGGFYQVNLEINELLIDRIKSYVMSLEPTKVLDLFSGSGNLSLPLAKDGVDCVLWESNPASVKDGIATIERLGLSTELTKRNAFRFAPGDEFFDVALLDPPRGGAKGVLASLTLTRPKAIIYVACSPVSFARDLKEAKAAGYKISRLTILDMFPQTEQCELLAFLQPG
jgi:23S rRNA (uracil1939-C5)-methyltransferase